MAWAYRPKKKQLPGHRGSTKKHNYLALEAEQKKKNNYLALEAKQNNYLALEAEKKKKKKTWP